MLRSYPGRRDRSIENKTAIPHRNGDSGAMKRSINLSSETTRGHRSRRPGCEVDHQSRAEHGEVIASGDTCRPESMRSASALPDPALASPAFSSPLVSREIFPIPADREIRSRESSRVSGREHTRRVPPGVARTGPLLHPTELPLSALQRRVGRAEGAKAAMTPASRNWTSAKLPLRALLGTGPRPLASNRSAPTSHSG